MYSSRQHTPKWNNTKRKAVGAIRQKLIADLCELGAFQNGRRECFYPYAIHSRAGDLDFGIDLTSSQPGLQFHSCFKDHCAGSVFTRDSNPHCGKWNDYGFTDDLPALEQFAASIVGRVSRLLAWQPNADELRAIQKRRDQYWTRWPHSAPAGWLRPICCHADHFGGEACDNPGTHLFGREYLLCREHAKHTMPRNSARKLTKDELATWQRGETITDPGDA